MGSDLINFFFLARYVFAQTVHVLHQGNAHLGDYYCPYAETGLFE